MYSITTSVISKVVLGLSLLALSLGLLIPQPVAAYDVSRLQSSLAELEQTLLQLQQQLAAAPRAGQVLGSRVSDTLLLDLAFSPSGITDRSGYGAPVNLNTGSALDVEEGLGGYVYNLTGVSDFQIPRTADMQLYDHEEVSYVFTVKNTEPTKFRTGDLFGILRSQQVLVKDEITYSHQSSDGSTYTIRSSGASIGDREWHHVVITLNSLEERARIYVDGVKVGEGIAKGKTKGMQSWGFYFGNPFGENFNGLIGQFQMHSLALSESEIESRAAAFAAKVGSAPTSEPAPTPDPEPSSAPTPAPEPEQTPTPTPSTPTEPAAPSAPATNGALSIDPILRDKHIFDRGLARGENSATIPLSGTAPAGAVIEARTVEVSGSRTASPWRVVATTNSNGQWQGTYTRGRSTEYLRAEARVQGTSVTVATTNTFGVGTTIALHGQSSDYHWIAFAGTPLEDVVDEDAVQIVDINRASDPADSTTSITEVTSAWTSKLRNFGDGVFSRAGVVAFANTLVRGVPGEKFLVKFATVSGTGIHSEFENSPDSRRRWPDEMRLHKAFDPYFVEGQRMSDTGLVVWAYTSSGNNNRFETAYGPLIFGKFPDGRLVTVNSSEYPHAHSWAEFYNWDKSRLGVGYNAYTQAVNVERMNQNPNYSRHLAPNVLGLNRHSQQYGEFRRGVYQDLSHPGTEHEDGTTRAGRIAAYGMLMHMAQVPPHDLRPFAGATIEWGPRLNGVARPDAVLIRSAAGREYTTLRRTRGEERLEADGTWRDGDVNRFMINGEVARNTFIVDDNGNLADTGNVLILKNDRSNWLPTDVLSGGRPEGATWKNPEDYFDDLHANHLIIKNDFPGIYGLPVTSEDSAPAGFFANKIGQSETFTTAPGLSVPVVTPIEPAPTPVPEVATAVVAPGERVRVEQRVNVRDPFGTNSPIVGVQEIGALGTVLNIPPQTANGYTWVPVNFDAGADGWVADAFLEVTDVTPVTPAAIGPSPSISTVLGIDAFKRDKHIFDRGLARGENSATIPLSGTAPVGAVIEARTVEVSGSRTASPWQVIATTGNNGRWEGTYTRGRSTEYLRAEARVRGTAVTAATTNTFGVGTTVALHGQSSDVHWIEFGGTPLETVLDEEAVQVVDINRAGDPADSTTSINEITNSWANAQRNFGDGVIGRAGVVAFANTLVRGVPGEKFLVKFATVSGTGINSEFENSPDSRRRWPDEMRLHKTFDPYFVEGQKMSDTGLVVWAYTSSNNQIRFETAYGPMIFGKFPDGRPVTVNSAEYPHAHSWAEFYNWDKSRLGVGFNSYQQAMNAEKMTQNPNYSRHLAPHVLGLNRHTQQAGELRNGVYVDRGHPGTEHPDGTVRAARVAAYGILMHMAQVPSHDLRPFAGATIEWAPTLKGVKRPDAVIIRSAEGREYTTLRRARGEARFTPDGTWRDGDVNYFSINGVNARNVRIVDDNGNLADTGNILILKNDRSTWTTNDILSYSISPINYDVDASIYDWKNPEDIQDETHKNMLTIATNFPGLDGLPLTTYDPAEGFFVNKVGATNPVTTAPPIATPVVNPAPTPVPPPTPAPAVSSPLPGDAIIVTDSASLTATLNSARGGEVIALRASAEPYVYRTPFRREMQSYAAPVTIRSVDPNNPAKIKQFTFAQAGNVVIDGLAFEAARGELGDRAVLLQLSSVKDIVVKNSTFDAGAPGFTETRAELDATAGGIQVRVGENVTIENNTITRASFGLAVFGSGDQPYNKNIIIRNNDINRYLGDAMRIVNFDGVLVEGNYLHTVFGTPQSVNHTDIIQVFSASLTKPSKNLTIRNNFINPGAGEGSQLIFMRNEAVDTAGGGEPMYYQNFRVEDNVIYGQHQNAIVLGESDGVVIKNNTLLYNQAPGTFSAPRISVSLKSKNVVVDKNIAHGVQSEWGGDNLLVQRAAPNQANYYGDLFVNALGGTELSLADLRALPGSIIFERGYGAAETRKATFDSLTALFKATPASNDRYAIQFDGSLSGDATGPLGSTATYRWEFGDGASQTGRIVTHTYERHGTYEVTLRVTKNGRTDTVKQNVKIADPQLIKLDFSEGIEDSSSYRGPIIGDADNLVRGLDDKVFRTQTGALLEISRGNGQIFNQQELSYEYWVKPVTLNGWFMRLHTALTGNYNSNGSISVLLTDAAGTNHSLSSPAGVIEAGEWQHIVFTYSTIADKAVLYVNGSKVAERAAGALTKPAQSWGLVLGNLFGGTQTADIGYFELRSDMLTAADVARRYNQFATLTENDTVVVPTERPVSVTPEFSTPVVTPTPIQPTPTSPTTPVNNQEAEDDNTSEPVPALSDRLKTVINAELRDKVREHRLELARQATKITKFENRRESELKRDTRFTYPLGLYDFAAEVQRGSTETVLITLDAQFDTSEWTYRKYNPNTDRYTDISDVVVYGATDVDGKTVTTISYEIEDNGPLDTDTRLGFIADPAGPALPEGDDIVIEEDTTTDDEAGDTDTTPTTSSSSSSGGGGGGRSSSRDDEADEVDTVVVDTTLTTPAVSTPTIPRSTGVSIPLVTANVSFIQPSVNTPEAVNNVIRFLNTYEGENLPLDGVYDAADNAAVQRFQTKYKREILDIWNLTEATGYVGLTTRLKMNFLIKGATAECPAFTEYNGGLNGIFQSAEVGRTQAILQELGMYTGPISNYWSPQTHEALITFQETFREVMLDPWNITKGTGYKYKTTNKFLNYFVGCDTGAVELEGVGRFDF